MSRDLLNFFSAEILIRAINVVLTPLLLSQLSVYDYGVLSIVNLCFNLFGLISNFGFKYLLNRTYESGTSIKVYLSIFKKIIIINILFLILIIIFEINYNIFGLSVIYLVLIYMFSFAVYNVYEVIRQIYKLEGRSNSYLAITSLYALVYAAVMISSVLFFKEKIQSIVINRTIIIIPLIFIFLIFVFNYRKKCAIFKLNYQYQEQINNKIIVFIPLVLFSLIQYSNGFIDRLLIRKFIGFEQVGYYTYIYNIGMLYAIFNTVSNSLLLSYIKDKIPYSNLLKITVNFNFLVYLICTITLPFFLIFFDVDSEYLSYYDNIIYVISSYALLGYSVLFINFINIYLKNSFYLLFISLTSLMITLVGNYLYLNLMGIKVAFLVTFLSYLTYLWLSASYFFLNNNVDKVMKFNAIKMVFQIFLIIMVNYIYITYEVITNWYVQIWQYIVT